MCSPSNKYLSRTNYVVHEICNIQFFFLTGVAVGSGQQSIVAYVNLGSYYLIGIPIGVVLGYVVNMEVKVCIPPLIIHNEFVVFFFYRYLIYSFTREVLLFMMSFWMFSMGSYR